MPQPFLETGEYGLLVPCLGIDDPIRRQSCLRQRRGKKILPRDTPQDGAATPCRDPGREQSCRSRMNGPIAAARDLVQRSRRQAATGQTTVDLRHAEWQDAGGTLFSGLDQPDFGAQGFDGGQRLHAGPFKTKIGKMFALCSSSAIESQAGNFWPDLFNP